MIPISIHPFTEEDLYDVIELEPPDIEQAWARMRWCLSTPYAVAIKSVKGEALMNGVITALLHGPSAWIGARWLYPDPRANASEPLLIDAMVKELDARGCTTQSVLTEADKVELFTPHDFRAVGDYAVMSGGKSEAPMLDEVELYEPHHAMGVLRLDQRATGEDRRELMIEHSYAGRIFVSKGRTLGNYIPLLWEGHIVAENTFAGFELLRWHLPHEPHVILPVANMEAMEFLTQRGYTAERHLVRMERGEALAWRPEMLYSVGGWH